MANLDHLVRTSLPLQVRHSFIRRSWYHPAKTNDKFGVKPEPSTALWTSTYRRGEEPCCSWLDFVVNDMPTGLNEWRRGYLYQPAKDLKILEINSHADLLALNDVYGYNDWVSVACNRNDNTHRIHRWPDYGKIGKKYDAIHLTEEGQWATRMPMHNIPFGTDNLYGWDCECTLWLRLHRRSMQYVGKVPLQYPRVTAQQLRDRRSIWEIQRDKMLAELHEWRATQIVDGFVAEHNITVTDDERQAMHAKAVTMLRAGCDVMTLAEVWDER